jgi:beta-lactamase class A
MNKYKHVLMVVLLLFGSQLPAAEATRKLITAGDPVLQSSLARIIRNEGLSQAVAKKELALVLVVVSDPDNPRMAELNGRMMVYAASLPKIAILLGAAVSIDNGRLIMDDALHRDMTDMIRYSCNPCATRVLELVGREELLEILQAPEYKFYDQENTGGLWVGKDYGPDSAYKRDPLWGLSHGATAFQAARFYYKLETGTLVSPEQSEMMLEALSKPGISHKFVKGLKDYPGIDIYRKSGTWRTYHADSALVHADGHAYILVALANNPRGADWLVKLAAPIHELATSGPMARRARAD